MNMLNNILLWIHIPAGTLSLILFWIPVMVKKGGNIHRKVGRIYYWCMWIVLITSAFLSIINLVQGIYDAAAFLGFLTVLTGYPLWYSYEILQQKKTWSLGYFKKRRIFSWTLFATSMAMLIGAILLKLQGMGILMVFFGALGIPAYKEAIMTKEVAMAKEGKIEMHIKGTIISGIAAYTAFFAFGGRSLLGELLPGYLQIIPWVLPTILGLTAMRIFKPKYAPKKSKLKPVANKL